MNPMNKDERIHELETLLAQKHRCDCGDSEACALVRRVTELEAWQELAFRAHPNIDLDIEALKR